MKEKKIGILTFHRVYNYGAVIQAYALQKVLDNQGYNSEIIDFTQRKQKDYTNIISIRNGIKRYIKTILLLCVCGKRIIRKKRFDAFIENKMQKSLRKYINSEQIKDTNNLYDIFLIGSDQVWNTKKTSDTSPVYFLSFVKSKKKIAYAPSVGIAEKNDLVEYKTELEKFSSISCREKGGATVLSNLLGRDVPVVLDPTLLATRDLYDEISNIEYESNYILYYTLDGKDKCTNNMDILCELKKKFNLELKIISPEWPFHKKYGEDVIDAGPEEFLSLIKNAALVCTTSFHGTALSLEFERPFYVLEGRKIKDERKRSILELVGATDRIISNLEEVKLLDSYKMDYKYISENMNSLRKKSKEYLMNALQE